MGSRTPWEGKGSKGVMKGDKTMNIISYSQVLSLILWLYPKFLRGNVIPWVPLVKKGTCIYNVWGLVESPSFYHYIITFWFGCGVWARRAKNLVTLWNLMNPSQTLLPIFLGFPKGRLEPWRGNWVGRIAHCVRPRGCVETPFVQLKLMEPQLRYFLSNLWWTPEREVGQPKGAWSGEGGTFLWVVQAEGGESCWLELL